MVKLSAMNKRILALAIPSVVANVTTPLLGLVDAAITGHMGSAVYIGAISVGGIMFNMIYWLFSFLRAGTSGLAAQACGAHDRDAQSLVLSRSLLVALGVGLAMVLLQVPLRWLLMWFVGPDHITGSLASRYFSILIYGAPAVLATYAMSGWFLGMQNSRMLMMSSIAVNVTNIVVSLALVYGLGWQIEGVATGSLVAQWIGVAVGVWLLRRYKLKMPRLSTVLHGGGFRRFFKINLDVMLRTVCMIAVTLWFTKTGAAQGPVILAVNTLLMQLFLLFSYMMDGFAFAAEALVGQYTGACDRKNLSQCVKSVMRWGVAMAALFTAVFLLGGGGFLGILTSDSDVIVASRDYWMWAVLVPFAGFASFTWDGVFIGATMSRGLLQAMAGAMVTFFVIELALYPHWGNHALWFAFIAYLVMRGVLQTFIYRSHSLRMFDHDR
jgi:MATE family multidrug resistance protein